MFRKHLPISRSKMTRTALIGRVEVIYDVFSEPKIYPALHVSNARGKTPGAFYCTPAHNLDRNYFYHLFVYYEPPRPFLTYVRT